MTENPYPRSQRLIFSPHQKLEVRSYPVESEVLHFQSQSQGSYSTKQTGIYLQVRLDQSRALSFYASHAQINYATSDLPSLGSYHRFLRTTIANTTTRQNPAEIVSYPILSHTELTRLLLREIDEKIESLSSYILDNETRETEVSTSREQIGNTETHSQHDQQDQESLTSNKIIPSEKAVASLEPIEIKKIDDNESTCIICYNQFDVKSSEGIVESPLRLPKCKHVFGDKCIKKWLEDSDSCPYCRDKLPSDFLVIQSPEQTSVGATDDAEVFQAHFRRLNERRYHLASIILT